MRVNVLVGGPLEMVPTDVIRQRENEVWIGVDRGARFLIKLGIVPQIAIGDFDSISKDELKALEEKLTQIKIYPPEKDFTDTQLGVKLAVDKYQADKIEVFGATGGRLDHLLANIFLPLQKEFSSYLAKIKFIDRQNSVSYYRPGNYTLRQEPGKKYLSFVNLIPVTGLNLPDEKYPLSNWTSQIPFAWTSNEFTAPENHFSFTTGIMAVIQCSDWLNDND